MQSIFSLYVLVEFVVFFLFYFYILTVLIFLLSIKDYIFRLRTYSLLVSLCCSLFCLPVFSLFKSVLGFLFTKKYTKKIKRVSFQSICRLQIMQSYLIYFNLFFSLNVFFLGKTNRFKLISRAHTAQAKLYQSQSVFCPVRTMHIVITYTFHIHTPYKSPLHITLQCAVNL